MTCVRPRLCVSALLKTRWKRLPASLMLAQQRMMQVVCCTIMLHASSLRGGCRDKAVLEASLRRSGEASRWLSRYVPLAPKTLLSHHAS
jgi:hypothetical protein